MLADSDGNTYLYGVGRIGEESDNGWVYYLGDALGTVHQLIDTNGTVTMTQRYEPFGDVRKSIGSVSTNYGFTGEWTDSTELIHLRARYYNPDVGRFISRDEWQGDKREPLSMNKWVYVNGNPIKLTDPSGHGVLDCTLMHFTFGWFSLPTAQEAIDVCREAFNQDYYEDLWSDFNCQGLNRQAWTLPNTVRDLFRHFICEQGLTHIYYNGSHPLTQELAKSPIVDKVRRDFYRGDTTNKRLRKFNAVEFGVAWLDTLSAIKRGEYIPITEFLGSFYYSVVELPGDRLGIRIYNETERSSGTHIPGRFESEGYRIYLEDLVEQNPFLKNEKLHNVISQYRVISILRPLRRDQTSDPEGGGLTKQTFTWTENNVGCKLQFIPWPLYVPFLDIKQWSGGY